MDDRLEKPTDEAFDLDDLLHPARAFSHPSDVVNDPDLTLNEKRAILASWASDVCAMKICPSATTHAEWRASRRLRRRHRCASNPRQAGG